jgi:hypothetical protein
VRIQGLDAHDGTIVQDGATFHLYGTRYACGFWWNPGHPTTFCGMGAWHAPSLTGPWTYDGLLFDPSAVEAWHQAIDPWIKITWQDVCGGTGWGCFNPRMVQRPSDGAWILWFNAPAVFAARGVSAYFAMTCAGPAGPCGPPAAAGGWLGGIVVKPKLSICEGGDFSIMIDDDDVGWLLCTQLDQTLAIEQLDASLLGGNWGIGRDDLVDGQTESPGAAKVGNGWVYTFADPNCGYCGGTGTSWGTKTDGVDDNGFATAAFRDRGRISTWSCNGQPRTAFNLDDGTAWQWIDDWLGSDHSHAIGNRNQTGADIVLSPLKTVDGVLQPLTCPPGGS